MAEPREHCVIVGAGHSAAQLCLSLRQADWSGRITLIGDEPHAPYHRPPLSKTALNPAQSDTRQPLRATSFYADNDIDLRLGVAVQRIDRDAKRIHLDNGELDYDTLVLATGSLHRRPPIPGVDDRRVFNLRTAADAEQVCAAATNGKRAAIIGGGFIGLEAAASLRKLGLDVV
ncbi:MAG: FAD-dependent oxidoreductase, partial [Planctomycetota bacterium]